MEAGGKVQIRNYDFRALNVWIVCKVLKLNLIHLEFMYNEIFQQVMISEITRNQKGNLRKKFYS